MSLNLPVSWVYSSAAFVSSDLTAQYDSVIIIIIIIIIEYVRSGCMGFVSAGALST